METINKFAQIFSATAGHRKLTLCMQLPLNDDINIAQMSVIRLLIRLPVQPSWNVQCPLCGMGCFSSTAALLKLKLSMQFPANMDSVMSKFRFYIYKNYANWNFACSFLLMWTPTFGNEVLIWMLIWLPWKPSWKDQYQLKWSFLRNCWTVEVKTRYAMSC